MLKQVWCMSISACDTGKVYRSHNHAHAHMHTHAHTFIHTNAHMSGYILHIAICGQGVKQVCMARHGRIPASLIQSLPQF